MFWFSIIKVKGKSQSHYSVKGLNEVVHFSHSDNMLHSWLMHVGQLQCPLHKVGLIIVGYISAYDLGQLGRWSCCKISCLFFSCYYLLLGVSFSTDVSLLHFGLAWESVINRDLVLEDTSWLLTKVKENSTGLSQFCCSCNMYCMMRTDYRCELQYVGDASGCC